MLGNRKVAFQIVVATGLIALSPFLMITYAQQRNQEQRARAEQRFMDMAIQARERTHDLRDFVVGEIGNISSEIHGLLNEADTLLAEGTIQNVTEAMKKYRTAYRHLHLYLEQHGVDIETLETTKGILEAVNRTHTRIERLNEILNNIRKTQDVIEPNYEQVQTYIEWGRGNLTEAATNLRLANQSMYLEPQNLTWAAHNLTKADQNIQEAHGALELIADSTNHWRIRNFLGELNRTRERMRQRLHQGGFNLTALLDELGYTSLEDFHQEIDALMETAQHRMEIREAVQDLWTIIEKLKEMDLAMQNHWQGKH